jgi:hypothetical protein
VDAGVVEHDPSRRDGPLELLLELPVVAEEVSCQRLGHGVDHSEALADLVHLLPTKSADFSWRTNNMAFFFSLSVFPYRDYGKKRPEDLLLHHRGVERDVEQQRRGDPSAQHGEEMFFLLL